MVNISMVNISMVNISTNINKTNNFLSHQITDDK
jgi:hypothetical protein